VQNPRDRNRPGGIRLRVPSTPTPAAPAAPPGVKPAAPSTSAKAPAEHVKILLQWVAHEKCDLPSILAYYGLTAIGDIPNAKFDDALARVKGKFPGFKPGTVLVRAKVS